MFVNEFSEGTVELGAVMVSFGTVWKYLTLTGTIWAQSNQYIKELVKIFISTVEAART
jgi:hypothetical protein